MLPFLDQAFAVLLALAHLAGAVLALHAAERAHTAQGGAAWAVALLLAPFLALPAYALLGPPDNRRLSLGQPEARRRALARIRPESLPRAPAPDAEAARRRGPLERLAPIPTLEAPRPELLVDGEAAFEAIFELIERAERRLIVQFYILRDDALGRRLKARLIARAREGVRVMLLYDWVGAHRTPARYWRELAEGGVEVRSFSIGRRPPRLLRLNFRNHRKMVAADGRSAVLGGFNVGDEYMGLDPGLGAWRDTALRLEGPAAAALEACFEEDWLWSGGASLPQDTAPEPPPPEAPGAPVLILPTGPADPRAGCTLSLMHLIAEARERVWIASPYFVPEMDLLGALKLAALRGVEVRLLIPDRPDHTVVWLAAYAYSEDALRAGLRLHRYTDGFMHQKAILIDDWAAGVGTVNLDSRSLRLNFEVTALTFDAQFAREVEAMLEADFARSRLYDEAAHARRSLTVRLLAPAARLLSPIL
ncbi:MAG: cardiolipin synthase [Pseudomonadota bacterium]